MRGINYEKKIVMYLFIGVCLFMFAGCCTCGRINADTKDIIAGNSRATENLKQQSRHLTEQLLIAENELQTSSKRVEELQTELSELNICLTNTNQKLSDYSTKLTEYETKLKFRAKIITIAAIILLIFIMVRVILLILKIKFGIKIPYLLNLLL